jgi:hypothetical protein
VLTTLERLSLELESPQSRPDQECRHYTPPLPTRTVLPTHMAFLFKGVNEYLEDFLARIGVKIVLQEGHQEGGLITEAASYGVTW